MTRPTPSSPHASPIVHSSIDSLPLINPTTVPQTALSSKVTTSSSSYEDDEEFGDTETNSMDYEPSPSANHIGDSLATPRSSGFVRSTGAPSPIPFFMPGSSLMGTPPPPDSNDGREDTTRAVGGDSEGIANEIAIDGLRDIIRLKKSQIRKLEDEVECLERACELAEIGKNQKD